MSSEDVPPDTALTRKPTYFELEIPTGSPPEEFNVLQSLVTAFGWKLTRTNASIRELYKDMPEEQQSN